MLPSRRLRCDLERAVPVGRVPPRRLVLAGLGLFALGFGGCAQQPQQQFAAAGHSKEYFPSSVYGAASRRVIADGQPVPRGGGQYLVGKPYTVAGHVYYPSERTITQIGNASWYGDAFHGRLTANGEIYDRSAFSAAHPTMPLPSYARVTNLTNHYSMIVRVNDRGPYASNRVMDVSRRVAEALDFKRFGTAKVKVEYVGRASLAGSDDAKLYATLRTDRPAAWEGDGATQVAEAAPRARVASLAPYVPAPQPRAVEQQRAAELERYRVPRPERSERETADTRRHDDRTLARQRDPSPDRQQAMSRIRPKEMRAARRDEPGRIPDLRRRDRDADTKAAEFAMRELTSDRHAASSRGDRRTRGLHGSHETEIADVLPPGRPSHLRPHLDDESEPSHHSSRSTRSRDG